MSENRRYDNVTVIDMQSVLQTHGSTVTFQVYRANLRATNLTDLQGPRLVELTIDGAEISGHDTVAAVKERVVPELDGIVQPTENVTFVLDRRPMEDDAPFFADHFIMLPVWIQIVIHEGSYDEVLQAVRTIDARSTWRP